MKIIESVPNFSEGRRQEVVERIVDQAKHTKGVWVLDWSMDASHNRSVVTLVGEPKGVFEALFKMTKTASELIDLRNHKGEHPRMGATDVVPLVPVLNTDMQECIDLSKQLGKRIADELKIPVYLYEKSATSPERESLSNIRKGEFEGFFEKIKDPRWAPDFGPTKVHPTAGVMAVGAREFLIAYNVNLNTTNLSIAKKIAKAVRHSSGGFRYVKAIGVELSDKGMVQVSMNMTNYNKSPLFRVFEVVKREAARYGVSVVSSEIVGMVPMQALLNVARYYLQLDDFTVERIVEKGVLEILAKEVAKHE